MNRRLLIAVLLLVLALLVLALAGMALARDDSSANVNRHPTMSGDFAPTRLAFTGLRASSIIVLSDYQGTGPRRSDARV